jgi:hypothetical protein
MTIGTGSLLETGTTYVRRYRVDEQWYNFKPDALADYRVGRQHVRFWLEWDCGTMNVRDLAFKFNSYAHYIASREWVREHARVLRLFCVAPDISQQTRMLRVAQISLAHASDLMAWTTTEVLLNEHGPLAAIWLQSMPDRSQAVRPGGSLRQSSFDVIPGKHGR